MSDRSTPRVTVVIPHYRRGANLRPTLERALAQRDVDVAVLIVDDASGPPAREELEAFRSEHVRIVDQPVNGGGAAARQRGTEEAEGMWVAYLDDDDLWEPEHLRRCIDAAVAAGARWAYGAIRYIDEAGHVVFEPPVIAAADLAETLRHSQALVTPSALVVERELALATGWDPRLKTINDWDFTLRLAEAAPGAPSPERTVGYVRHEAALSRNTLNRAAEDLAYLRRKRRAAGALPVKSASFHRWLAYELRAAGERRASAREFLLTAITAREPAHAARALRVLLAG